MENDGSTESDDEQLPWADVEASRHNTRLQRGHDKRTAHSQYDHRAMPCPKCGRPPAVLAWFYFESPPSTWEDECGCAGWITVCDLCHVQVDFFVEVMN
jgi:hypothetical protein